MKSSEKRLPKLNGLYCAHCYIRVGAGERPIVRDGKIYHSNCYAKTRASAAVSGARN
jgi:hypothetical protein